MRLVARVLRFAEKSRQARLPIQDELTLALVGRISRSLIKVERPHRRETQGRLCKHKEVEHEPKHIGFLGRGGPPSSMSVGLTWEANPVLAVCVGQIKAWWSSQ
jgi:hypothetical protein